MSLTSKLYKGARFSATGRAIRKGRIPNRAKNIAIGREIGGRGEWRRLWGGK